MYGLPSSSNKRILSCIYIGLSLVTFICALQVGTQYIAYKLNYQEGLGIYLFIVNGMPIYPFWSVFSWDFTNVQDIINQGIEYTQLSFILPQLLFFTYVLFLAEPKGNKKLHGTAKFADKKEIATMGYFQGEGVYVGGWQKNNNSELLYLRHNGPEHCLCFAPTRSGKGVGLIIPTLLSWLGSSIVLDIKGENWALTSGYRKSLGHKVLKFDPSDTSGKGCRFNPIDEIRLDTFYAVQDVQNLAMMIVDPDGKGLPDHWTKAAFAFFSGIVLHCCIVQKVRSKRTATMQDLALMMSGYGYKEGVKSLFEEMVSFEHSTEMESLYPNIDKRIGEEIHAFIASSAKEMLSKADAESSGVVSSALVNMALYKDPVINMNTSESDFKIADLMNHDKPVDLYLVLSPASIDRLRPLIRLICDMIIRRTCKDMTFKDGASVKGYKHRLLLMLDEFTSLGKLPIIEKAIAYIAGYGGKMYLIVQDITQLNGVYGKENALMANCHVRIAYAPNTIETAKVLSEMTGKTTVVDRKSSISYSKGGQSHSVNIAETARALLTPDECMRLPSAEKDSQGNVIKPADMLIFTAGQNPIYGKQILYFKDPVFMERAKIEAPLISDTLYVKRRDIELSETELSIDFDKYIEKVA